MTTAWVRKQIEAGRLPAVRWTTGRRPTYRIATADWAAFVARYSRRSRRDTSG